jgi:hypothetical protein
MKKWIVVTAGKIISPELNTPLTYLQSLADDFTNNNSSESGSSFVQHRPFLKNELLEMPDCAKWRVVVVLQVDSEKNMP